MSNRNTIEIKRYYNWDSCPHVFAFMLLAIFTSICCGSDGEWSVCHSTEERNCNYWECNEEDSCVPDEYMKEVEYFGDGERFGTEIRTKTCSDKTIALKCVNCPYRVSGTPSSVTIPILPYWGSMPSFEWGEQGSSVVVCGCGSVFPANGVVTYPKTRSSPRCIFPWSYDCPEDFDMLAEYGYPGDDLYAIGFSSDTHKLKAEFDPDVFIVDGKRESPCEVSSPVSITLVNDDCETLKKAMDASVKIYHQKFQSASVPTVCCKILDIDEDGVGDEDDCGLPMFQSELSRVTEVASIGVKFAEFEMESKCPDKGSPNSFIAQVDRGSSGCSSCSGGSGIGQTLSIGHAVVNIGHSLDRTLNVYACPLFSYGLSDDPDFDDVPSLDDPDLEGKTLTATVDGIVTTNGVEVNAPGVWIRASHYPYRASRPTYVYEREDGGDENDIDDDVVTKVSYSFSLTVHGTDTYYYKGELEGPWQDVRADGELITDADDLAMADFIETFFPDGTGRIPLQYVTRNNETILEFKYDSNLKVTKQISYSDYNNNERNGYIIYDYATGELSSLERIWIGTVESQHEYLTGGRWIDVSYTSVDEDGMSYLDQIEYGSCSSCQTSLVYETSGPTGDLLTKITETDGTVLATYEYDSNGQYLSFTRGSGEDVILVNTWDRSYFDPADPIRTSGDNMLLRRDFVTNTKYRASVSFADNKGSLVKEIYYHGLQEIADGELKGPYSVYRYYWQEHEDEENGEENWKRYVTQYPKGNRLYKYYDDDGNVIKIQWSDSDNPESEYTYLERSYGGDTQCVVETEKNANDGTTTYTYCNDAGENRFNVETRTEPAPSVGNGVFGHTTASQETTYIYDTEGRIWYESKKDSSGTIVYTGYVYDSVGNLKHTHEVCSAYNSQSPSDPTGGFITYYEYNDYNQLETTTYPSGKVQRKFYSDAGTVIAEAVYDDYAIGSAVSATIYVYVDGKLDMKKTAKKDTSFTFTETEVADGGGSLITWIQEKYNYDVHGRKIEVVTDNGGQNLKTTYEYNNQDEVTKVLRPDGRYTKTIRDGRGLVVEEITGIQVDSETEEDKATIRYFYDLNGNLIRKVGPMRAGETEGVTEIYVYNSKDQMVKSRRGK